MRHPGVDGERHRDAARRRARRELLVLRAEHLAAACLDEQGRQSPEIGIERREARIIARECTAAVVARLEQWVERRPPAENAVGIGIRRARRARTVFHRRPRRGERNHAGLWEIVLPQIKGKRECEVAARRVSDEDDILRARTACEQSSVDANGVLQRGGVEMGGCDAVVHAVDRRGVHQHPQPQGECPMHVAEPHNIAAAVQLQQDARMRGVGGRIAVNGNTAERLVLRCPSRGERERSRLRRAAIERLHLLAHVELFRIVCHDNAIRLRAARCRERPLRQEEDGSEEERGEELFRAGRDHTFISFLSL